MTMQNFHYFNPCDIHLGNDVLSKLPELIEGCKVLLVYGGIGTKASGIIDDITTILDKNNIEWLELGGSSIPSYERVKEGIRLCQENNVECILGIGGCSCMDLAKVISFGVYHDNNSEENDNEDEDELWSYLSGKKETSLDEPHLLLGLIPSYPSGGSEADDSADIVDTVNNESGSLFGIYPDFSLLNPEYSFRLNAENTAYAAAVTFIQASINYLGSYSPIAESFTLTVLDAVRDSVNTALADPHDYDARATQMWCSALSNMGILSCGKGDSWSWSIYADVDLIRECMDLKYREALTILFPRWLETYALHHGDDVRRYMVEVFDVDGSLPTKEAVKEGIQLMIMYFSGLGIKMNYSDFGKTIDEYEMREIVESYVENYDEANETPSELSINEIMNMFLKCS